MSEPEQARIVAALAVVVCRWRCHWPGGTARTICMHRTVQVDNICISPAGWCVLGAA